MTSRLAARFALLLTALLPLAALAASPAAKAPPPVEGTDYVVIEGGTPYAPLAGQVEVVEIFGYWCHHCASFQPRIAAWKSKLPAHVRFNYVPAVYGSTDPFARGYFAAEAAGILAKTHEATYRAIHDEKILPRNATVDEIASFYGQRGLDAAKLRTAMLSPTLDTKLERAHQFAVRSGIEGTPTLIVNGKYRIITLDRERVLSTAEYLIARESRKR